MQPKDAGGCRITGYAVFRDDGVGGNIDTEVNLDDDPAVRELPSLNTLAVTYFPVSTDGQTFRFQVQVFTT